MADRTEQTRGDRDRRSALAALVLVAGAIGVLVWAGGGGDDGPTGRLRGSAGTGTAREAPRVAQAPGVPAAGEGASAPGAAGAPGEDASTRRVGLEGAPVGLEGAPGLVVGAAAAADPVDADAPANRETGVRGRVVDAAGVGVPGARVHLRGVRPGAGVTVMRLVAGPDGALEPVTEGETRSREVEADGDGRWEVRGLDAAFRYVVHARAAALLPGRAPAPALRAGAVVEARPVVLARPARIEGVVLDPEGRPVEGAQVALVAEGGAPGFFPAAGRAGAVIATRGVGPGGPAPLALGGGRGVATDAAGRFVLEAVAPGTWGLEARRPGLRAARRDGLEVAEGARLTDVTLRLGAPLAVRVRVVDEVGRAVVGATVDASSGFGGPLGAPPGGGAAGAGGAGAGGGGVTPGRATTDGRGEALVAGLEQAELVLSVAARGFQPWREAIRLGPQDPETPREVLLRPGATLTLRVEDPDGGPVAGAFALLEPRARGARVEVRAGPDQRSGADGACRVEGVAPGAWRLRVQARGWAPAALDVDVPAGVVEHDAGRVVLGRLAGLDVLVLDPDGAPAAGAHVEAAAGGRAGTFVVVSVAGPPGEAPPLPGGLGGGRGGVSDAAGRARLEGLEPGVYAVRAVRAGAAEGRVEGVQVGGPAEGAAASPAVVVRLTRGGRVAGRLQVAGGAAPPSELGVALLRAGVPVARATARDGAFAFDLVAPGRYAVTPEHPTRGPAPEVEVEDGREVAVTVTLEARRALALVVVGPDGAPVAGARVALGHLVAVHPGDPVVAQPVAQGATDAQGRVALEDLAPGRWGVAVRAPGHPAWTYEVVLPEGDATGAARREVRLPATARATVRVAVRDPAGAPRGGAQLELSSAGDGPLVAREGATGPDGGCVLGDLPAGRYALRARAAGLVGAPLTFELAPGATLDLAPLELAPAASLLLVVRGTGPGGPEHELLVRPAGDRAPGRLRFLVVRPGETVRVDDLDPGPHELELRAPGREPWRGAAVASPAPTPVEVGPVPRAE